MGRPKKVKPEIVKAKIIVPEKTSIGKRWVFAVNLGTGNGNFKAGDIVPESLSAEERKEFLQKGYIKETK